ncbi:hypothetical protein R1sor_019462 [Riccia sorocarpa]|uniref:Uncharacterized protein n=1 Tax=Riccia sorocarpa TaxID=122646 RepID=A0ABD3IG80_9MARC
MLTLGLRGLVPTPILLRMADGRKNRPLGEIRDVPTLIGEHTYLVTYIIMDLPQPAQFAVLLGMPWLVDSDAHTSWKSGKLTFGSSRNPSTLRMYNTEDPSPQVDTDGVLLMDGITPTWHPNQDEDDDLIAFISNCFLVDTVTDEDTPIPKRSIWTPAIRANRFQRKTKGLHSRCFLVRPPVTIDPPTGSTPLTRKKTQTDQRAFCQMRLLSHVGC